MCFPLHKGGRDTKNTIMYIQIPFFLEIWKEIEVTRHSPDSSGKWQLSFPSIWTRHTLGFPGGNVILNPFANAVDTGDTCSIPGSGRSPGGGNDNPLQYSCLGNPTNRGAWQAIVHGVTKRSILLSDWARTHTDTHTHRGVFCFFLLSASQDVPVMKHQNTNKFIKIIYRVENKLTTLCVT